MLIRNDPFRDLDRVAQQLVGTAARPAMMQMDAWRSEDELVVHLDVPGVDPSEIDLDVERNVVTVKVDRPGQDGQNGQNDLLVAERPRGVFSRQIMLGDSLDTDNVQASYDAGVLKLRFPIAERAKARKIQIGHSRESDAAQIGTGDDDS